MDIHLMMLMEVVQKELRVRRRHLIQLSTQMNHTLVVDGADAVLEHGLASLVMHYLVQFSQIMRFIDMILLLKIYDMV